MAEPTAEAPELLACRFCNSGRVLPYGTADGRETVLCDECGASGPCCNTSAEAIAAWNRRTPPVAISEEMVGAWNDVLNERRRQIEQEGWTIQHDDRHDDASMAAAAACYALASPEMTEELTVGYDGKTHKFPVPKLWPKSWSSIWWKPKDRRSDLVRAAALIVAEIERLDRLRKPPALAPVPAPKLEARWDQLGPMPTTPELEEKLANVKYSDDDVAPVPVAPQEGVGEPTAWQLVPTKHEGKAGLTHEMCDAFWRAYNTANLKHGHWESTNAGYNAMLAVAPQPTGEFR